MTTDDFLARLDRLANHLDDAHQLVDQINLNGTPTQRINLRSLLARAGGLDPMTFDRMRRAIDTMRAEGQRRAA